MNKILHQYKNNCHTLERLDVLQNKIKLDIL